MRQQNWWFKICKFFLVGIGVSTKVIYQFYFVFLKNWLVNEFRLKYFQAFFVVFFIFLSSFGFLTYLLGFSSLLGLSNSFVCMTSIVMLCTSFAATLVISFVENSKKNSYYVNERSQPILPNYRESSRQNPQRVLLMNSNQMTTITEIPYPDYDLIGLAVNGTLTLQELQDSQQVFNSYYIPDIAYLKQRSGYLTQVGQHLKRSQNKYDKRSFQILSDKLVAEIYELVSQIKRAKNHQGSVSSMSYQGTSNPQDSIPFEDKPKSKMVYSEQPLQDGTSGITFHGTGH